MNRSRHFLVTLLCVFLGPILTTGCAVYETRILKSDVDNVVKENYVSNVDNVIKENLRQYFLPKGIISVTMNRGVTDGIPETITTATATVKMVADLKQKFFLKTNHNFIYDDQNIIETDDEGLLKSLNATSTFKGPEILEKAGEVAGYALKMATMMPKVVPPKLKDQLCPDDMAPFTIEVLFDPYDNVSIKNAKDIFKKFCFELENTALLTTTLDSNVKIIEKVGKDNKGILYRLPTSYTFDITSINAADTKRFVVTIPDKENIAIFNYDRGVFVSRVITLNFNKGLLTKTDVTSPSELYGFMQLLLSPVKGVSEAITGQFGAAAARTGDEVTYIQNKTALDKLKNP